MCVLEQVVTSLNLYFFLCEVKLKQLNFTVHLSRICQRGGELDLLADWHTFWNLLTLHFPGQIIS